MSAEYFMGQAMIEAKKAYRKKDVPVGAVIVYKNKIIARAHNQKEKRKNAIMHAEILAITKACKKMKTWHLDECTMYVTLEPCLMCAGAMIQSRISKIVYATSSPKFGYVSSVDKILNENNNHIPKIETGILEKESKELLQTFFRNKRDKK